MFILLVNKEAYDNIWSRTLGKEIFPNYIVKFKNPTEGPCFRLEWIGTIFPEEKKAVRRIWGEMQEFNTEFLPEYVATLVEIQNGTDVVSATCGGGIPWSLSVSTATINEPTQTREVKIDIDGWVYFETTRNDIDSAREEFESVMGNANVNIDNINIRTMEFNTSLEE